MHLRHTFQSVVSRATFSFQASNWSLGDMPIIEAMGFVGDPHSVYGLKPSSAHCRIRAADTLVPKPVAMQISHTAIDITFSTTMDFATESITARLPCLNSSRPPARLPSRGGTIHHKIVSCKLFSRRACVVSAVGLSPPDSPATLRHSVLALRHSQRRSNMAWEPNWKVRAPKAL